MNPPNTSKFPLNKNVREVRSKKYQNIILYKRNTKKSL